MANIKQTVDFSQGTLNNLVVVNNKLQLSSVAAPSFTRNSIAYKNDGTLVNTNLPRYEQGKFGQAVMVEEGTTNLVPNPLAKDNLTGIGYYFGGGSAGIIERSTSLPSGCPWLTGVKVTITTAGIDANVIFKQTDGSESATGIPVTAGATYTYSIWLYIPSDSGITQLQLRPIEWNSSGGVVKDSVLVSFNTKGVWQRVVATWTLQSTTAKVTLRVKAYGTGEFYATACMLEQKPYATSFIDGTRAAETLTIPTAGVINPLNAWTLEWLVRCGKLSVINHHLGLGAIWDSSAPNNRISFHLRRYSSPYRVAFWSSATGWYESSVTVADDSDVYIAFAYDGAGTLRILVNGQLAGTFSVVIPNANYDSFVLGRGSSAEGLEMLNQLIDDLRISNRARTDAEIQAAYASGQPLPVDEWTTYLLRFDDNLNYGQGGYYISPEYDVSSVNKAARGKVYWQEDADGIQRIVYAKLDNQADWTQVTNGGLLPISAGDVLTNRKLQLKVKMLKVI